MLEGPYGVSPWEWGVWWWQTLPCSSQWTSPTIQCLDPGGARRTLEGPEDGCLPWQAALAPLKHSGKLHTLLSSVVSIQFSFTSILLHIQYLIVTAGPEEGRVHESPNNATCSWGEASFWRGHCTATLRHSQWVTSLCAVLTGERRWYNSQIMVSLCVYTSLHCVWRLMLQLFHMKLSS